MSVLQQLLECNKCRNSYHPECLGPNYPTKPTKKKKVWVSAPPCVPGGLSCSWAGGLTLAVSLLEDVRVTVTLALLLEKAIPGDKSTLDICDLFKSEETLQRRNSTAFVSFLPDLHQVCALQELRIHHPRQRLGRAVVPRLLTVPRLCQTLC